MKDEDLTREELLAELDAMRRRVEVLEPKPGPGNLQGIRDDKDDSRGKSPAPPKPPRQARPQGDADTNENYRSVVERASEAICATQGRRQELANQANTELIGCSQEELVSIRFADLAHPEDRAQWSRININRLYTQESLPVRTASHSRSWLLCSSWPNT